MAKGKDKGGRRSKETSVSFLCKREMESGSGKGMGEDLPRLLCVFWLISLSKELGKKIRRRRMVEGKGKVATGEETESER